jgi:hypothetical protein
LEEIVVVLLFPLMGTKAKNNQKRGVQIGKRKRSGLGPYMGMNHFSRAPTTLQNRPRAREWLSLPTA